MDINEILENEEQKLSFATTARSRMFLVGSVISMKIEINRLAGNYENDCQSALKIDPPSASKIDPPQVVVFSY